MKTIQPSTIMQNIYALHHPLAMLAGVQLDVFSPLRDGPLEAAALAGILGVAEDRITPLLYSLVAAGLLQVADGKFANTPEAGQYLVRGQQEYMGGVCDFYNTIMQSIQRTAESIRTGIPQRKVDWQTLPEEKLMKFFRTQYHDSVLGGQEIADKLDFSEYRTMLDAGGGTGGTSISICQRFPGIQATVADLPKVVEVAKVFIAEAGLSDRIGVTVANLCDQAPEGKYDVALLRNVLQTLSRDQAEMTLKCVNQSLEPGGRIFIIGSIMENSQISPLPSLMYDLLFLNIYSDGKSYTENDYWEMLANAGFTDINVEHEVFLLGYGLIRATKL